MAPFQGPYQNPEDIGYGVNPNSMLGATMLPNLARVTPQAPQQQPQDMPQQRSLQDLIAPYQDIASSMRSPYIMLEGAEKTRFGQNHPNITGGIDNALAAIALTQTGAPASAGQNVSAALRANLEVNQLKRQNKIQDAMLPYQLMQPQLTAEKEIAQTQAERAHAQLYGAMLPYYGARTAQADANATKLGGPQVRGKIIAGLDNTPYQEVQVPGGLPRLMNLNTQEFATPEEEMQIRQTAATTSASGLTPGKITAMLGSLDPAVKAAGRQAEQDYIRLTSAAAGGRAGAVQGATEPQKQADKYYDTQEKVVLSNQARIPSREEWKKSLGDMALVDYTLASGEDQEAMYNKSTAPLMEKRLQLQAQLSAYQASGASRKKISFQDWMKNPDAVAAAPSAAKHAGIWNAAKGIYETSKN